MMAIIQTAMKRQTPSRKEATHERIVEAAARAIPVSYTHLTLPTILRV